MDALSQKIAAEVGLGGDDVRRCVTAALRELHRLAIVDETTMTGALMSTYFSFGEEAAYHFGGILIEASDGDKAAIWSETMARFLGRQGYLYRPLVSEWVAERQARLAKNDPDIASAPVLAARPDATGNGPESDTLSLLAQLRINPALDWSRAVGWCSYVPRPDALDFDPEEIRHVIGDARADMLVNGALPSEGELRLWEENAPDSLAATVELWEVTVWMVSPVAAAPIYAVTRVPMVGGDHVGVGLFGSVDAVRDHLRTAGRIEIASGVLAEAPTR